MILEVKFYFLVTLFIGEGNAASIQDPLAVYAIENTLSYMRWQAFTLIPCQHDQMKSGFNRMKEGSTFQLQMNIMNPTKVDLQTLDPNWKIVIEICNEESISTFSEVLSLRRPSDSILALVTDSETLPKFNQIFSEFSLSRSFFRFSQNQLYHHITFRMEERLLEHNIDCRPMNCALDLKSFSYQGAKLYGKTKSWAPWFVLEAIHEGGTPRLKTSGILHEFMDIISTRYNFTLVPDPAQEWGSLPVTGSWMDSNATFTGIFDDAVQGNTDVVLSLYAIMAERYYWVDSTFAIYQTKIQFLTNSQVQMPDHSMLWRPLTMDSWIIVAACTFLVAGGIYLPRKLIRNRNESWYSCRVAVINGWLLFNLVSAYYNGALTMFLSSFMKIEIPTLNEGLELYPNWKMVVPLQSQLHFLVRQNHNSQVRKYLELVSQKESQLVPDNFEQALKLLMKPGHFLYTPDVIILSYELEKKSEDLQYLTLESLGNNGFTRYGLLLPKFSPHTRIFNSGEYVF